ncbi:MAG: META domain-containing protein [Bacteroidales bacterium]
MKKLIYSTILFGSLVAFGACSGNSKKEAVNLQGEWVITSVNGVKVQETPESPFLNFDLTEKRVNGNAGCNNFFGEVIMNEADASSLSFDKMGATKMMCPNDSLEMEVFKALNEVKSFGSADCDVKGKTCAKLMNAQNNELLTIQKRAIAQD